MYGRVVVRQSKKEFPKGQRTGVSASSKEARLPVGVRKEGRGWLGRERERSGYEANTGGVRSGGM